MIFFNIFGNGFPSPNPISKDEFRALISSYSRNPDQLVNYSRPNGGFAITNAYTGMLLNFVKPDATDDEIREIVLHETRPENNNGVKIHHIGAE